MKTRKAPAVPQFTARACDLLRAINRIKHAVAPEPSRSVLTTVCIERNGEYIRLVTSDNYRIAWADVNCDGSEWAGQALVPASALAVWTSWLRPLRDNAVQVKRDGSILALSQGKEALTLVLMDGIFPDWRTVIPAHDQHSIAVNHRYLKDAGAAHKCDSLILRLFLTDPLSALVIETQDGTSGEAIMPVKVPWA